ncbi:MAG: tetratricopeptide repeat protein, partial [Candidatus Nealsonbacteria bacterium]|nr:tetratricopeptide repeat protein [Candidatus Nealsonbacteria bacterium]
QIYLAKLNTEIKRNDIPSAQVSQNAQRLVQLSVNSAQRAISLNPSDSSNWSVKGYISLNLIPLYIGFDEEAIKAYEEAIKLEPTNPYYPTQEGIVLATAASQLKEDQKADREKKLTDAEAKFKRAIELKSDYASAMYQLAGIYQAQGKTDEAINELKKAEIAAPFDIGLIFQLGLVYYGTGEYNDAQFEFEKAININPQYSNALYFLGLTYNKLGARDKAIEMMEKVSSLNSDNEEVKKVLNNLKNGRDALDGITPNASAPVVENPGEIQSSPQEANQGAITPSSTPEAPAIK